MTTSRRTTSSAESIDEATLAAYLQANPDFFTRHEYLLTQLQLPHQGGEGTISLVERQVAVLRAQKHDLDRKLRHLTDAAIENEALLAQIQQLILELIGRNGIDALTATLTSTLRETFQADAVGVRLFVGPTDRPEYLAPDSPALKPVRACLQQRRSVCGHLNEAQKRLLFGPMADVAASGALVPLCAGRRCVGVLGVGSSDGEHFHAEMGTVFLDHLGAISGRLIELNLR